MCWNGGGPLEPYYYYYWAAVQADLLPLGKVHLHIASASFGPIATVAALLCYSFVWLQIKLRKPSSIL